MELVTEMTDPTQIMLRDIPRASEIEKNIDKVSLDPETDKDFKKEMKASAKSVFTQRCKLCASRQDKLSDDMNKL